MRLENAQKLRFSLSWSHERAFPLFFEEVKRMSRQRLLDCESLECRFMLTTVIGTASPEPLSGSDEADVVWGMGQDDVIDGGLGDDWLHGGGGNDVLNGGAGADELDGSNHDDTINGGTGDDLLIGGNGEDSLDGGLGSDELLGGNGDDKLLGGEGDDIVDGGNYNDTLDGGAGSDVVLGGNGHDTLIWDPACGAGTLDDYDGGFGRDRLVIKGVVHNDELRAQIIHELTTKHEVTINGAILKVSGIEEIVFEDCPGCIVCVEL
jgi:Ca2+-binding RTX toxin-like protein